MTESKTITRQTRLSYAWTHRQQTRTTEYKPLPGDQSIRMLVLEPGRENDSLKGTFDVIGIDSPDFGSHETLSYVWGTLAGDSRIFIHSGGTEQAVTVTPNLYQALQRLRLSDRKRSIWVDQICIDQQNFRERSHQIQFMNRLYKHAGHVLVWLGPDKDGIARSTFQSIIELDNLFLDEKKAIDFHFAYTRDLETQSRESWVHLDRLMELEWFTRGWIVQEIGTKAAATLIWGEAEIEWLVLSRVCERLQVYYHLRSKFKIRTDEVRYLFERFAEPDGRANHENRFNFIYELHRARRLKFSDQRDRVFAFLGHFSRHGPNEELRNLKANYERTVIEVYKDVAKRALRGEKGTTDGSALIALAAVQHSSLQNGNMVESKKTSGPDEGNKLPSWVPDWRIFQSFILTEPSSPHKAHGTSCPRLEIDDNTSLLRIQGLEIDTIEACSRSLGAGEFYTNASPRQYEIAITHIWRDVCRQTHFDLSHTYLNGESSFFAYMQTLSNGCIQIAKREHAQYSDIPKSRWLMYAASYLVQALEGSDAVASDLREIAREADNEYNAEQWSRSANGATENRAFARSRKGYFVLGPGIMNVGDIVCVLFGGKMPFCLRPCGSHYLLVGECYVHGLMEGEAMQLAEQRQLFSKAFNIV
ncbi:HET-domain-containing protein [Xylaria sp. FL0933]|nr:HET-domain-containing protein [Xylaria sp. FL0933]